MSEFGRLIPASPGDLSYLSGHIQTIDGRLDIALDGDPGLCGQNRPSHRITMRTRDNRSSVPAGNAWLKTARNGPNPGKRFFSIQIDFPERSAPLNVAAFEDEKTQEWIIVWRRRGGRQAAAS